MESAKAIEANLLHSQIMSNGLEKNEKEKEIEKARPKHTGLVLAGVSASWQADPIVDTLRNITLTAQPGEFVGIVGLVGSGKVRSERLFNIIISSP